MIPWPIYIFILIELSVVAYLDLKYRKIRNIWILLNLLISLGLFIFLPQYYVFKIESFQFSIAFIFVGFMLYLMKVMGGGDSKYLSTMFLMVPLSLQDSVFSALLISTICVGLIVFIKNLVTNLTKIIESFKNSDLNGVKSCFGTKFAFAPVILIAWLWIGTTLVE